MDCKHFVEWQSVVEGEIYFHDSPDFRFLALSLHLELEFCSFIISKTINFITFIDTIDVIK